MMDLLAVLVLLDSRYRPLEPETMKINTFLRTQNTHTCAHICLSHKHAHCALTCVPCRHAYRETVVSLALLVPWDWLVPLDLLDLLEPLADLETVERL